MPNRVSFDSPLPEIARSEAWFARARGLIPAGTQTLAKGPTQYVEGVAPKYLERGRGCRVWDVDGNQYIDYVMSWGPLILGHAHPDVVRAAQQALERGSSYGAPTSAEVEFAELLCACMP